MSNELREELTNRIASSDETLVIGDEGPLTERELTVFKRTGQGLKRCYRERLNLSPSTVETYRSHIKPKTGIADGAKLNRIAYLRCQSK